MCDKNTKKPGNKDNDGQVKKQLLELFTAESWRY